MKRLWYTSILATLTAVVHAVQPIWMDSPQYVDNRFILRIDQAPGFSARHRELLQVALNDPQGVRLQQALRIIQGKEDALSARIMASWIAQTRNPEAAILKFKQLTALGTRRDSTGRFDRILRFRTFTLGYFGSVIVRPMEYWISTAKFHKVSKSMALRYKRTEELMRNMRRHYEGLDLRFTQKISRANLVEAMMYFSGQPLRENRFVPGLIRVQETPPELKALLLWGSNESVTSKLPAKEKVRGSLLAMEFYRKDPENLGYALHAAACGQMLPNEAKRATELLMRQKDMNLQYWRLVRISVGRSSEAFDPAKEPGGWSLYWDLQKRIDRMAGFEEVRR